MMSKPAIACLNKLLLVGCATVFLIGSAGAQEVRVLWTGDFEKNWKEKWHVDPKRHRGLDNFKVVADPSEKFPTIMRVKYAKGSASPTFTKNDHAPVGGGQFYASLGIAPRDSLHLRYYVRFAKDFDFVKGGSSLGCTVARSAAAATSRTARMALPRALCGARTATAKCTLISPAARNTAHHLAGEIGGSSPKNGT